jgi:AcrR family transcriptional regulator
MARPAAAGGPCIGATTTLTMPPGRPRTRSDDELLDATVRAIGAVGPTRLTLADVAREAGVAPATLVQRFGSKRALLLALSGRAAGRAAAAFPRPGNDPLKALADGLVALTAPVADPDAFAHHLAFLQLDLADPELRANAAAHARAVRRAIRRLLDAAVAAGQLAPCDTPALAAAVHAIYQGALIAWALDRRGTPGARVRAALRALLAPRLLA